MLRSEGAVSKWLNQAMRGSAFFQAFLVNQIECMKKTALKVLFFMNSEHNKLAQNILHSLLWQDIFPESINGVVIWRTLTLK